MLKALSMLGSFITWPSKTRLICLQILNEAWQSFFEFRDFPHFIQIQLNIAVTNLMRKGLLASRIGVAFVGTERGKKKWHWVWIRFQGFHAVARRL